ncbi:MAG: GAF domain-containing protein [Desulfohalobiaceae bacterium]|nr:GAF domain-containing protein [Desulfohalobiaceae bacterium]
MYDPHKNFQILRQVSQTFSATFNRDKLLQLIVDTCQDLFDLKAVSIYLNDETKNKFLPVKQKGLSDSYMNSGLTGPKVLLPLLKKEGLVHCPEAATDARLDNHEAKKREGIVSMLIVPIKVMDRFVGIMSLYKGESYEFPTEAIELVTALAEQAGQALEHARLVGWLRRNNRIIREFTVRINATLNFKEILDTLLSEIVDFLEIKGSSILLFDEHRERLQFKSGLGLSKSYATRDRLVVEESVARTLDGETVYIEDATQDARVKFKKEKEEEGIVSILSVPIQTRDAVIGALRLYCGEKRLFPEDQVDLVQSLALIGGLAIQNASMHKMIKEEMKDLEDDIWCHRAWF